MYVMVAVLAVTIYTVIRQQFVTVEGASDLSVVEEMYTLIDQYSVYNVKHDTLVEGALRGMAGAIKDPYSTYFSKEEAAVQKQSLASERVGIGIELMESNGKFLIVSPVKSSPAEKAGIRPNDELIQIDEVRLEGKSMGEVMQLMQGQAGEEVTLVLYRQSLEKHIKVTVKRAEMTTQTVKTQIIAVEDVEFGFITVSLFAENTAEQWVKAVDELKGRDIKGLIVDVRDNPGGYLHSVAGLLSTLADKEKTFAYMENSEAKLEAVQTVQLENIDEIKQALKKWPTVILQNEGSASASEVFAAALQSWQTATVVGTTSFGKGTVQESWDLGNGGQVKLSTNKWLTPKKEWIHKKGIVPDVDVEQHPLFAIEFVPLRGSFEVGDFSEEIAYVQKVLYNFGFQIVRQDGYFDETTKEAVIAFRERFDVHDGQQIDELFGEALQEEIKRYKQNIENDLQLQMGVSYLMHQLGY